MVSPVSYLLLVFAGALALAEARFLITLSLVLPLFVLFAIGILNWCVALPVDTLKTRLQVAPEGKYSGMRG